MTIESSNKRGGARSQPLETIIHNPQKDWLKYTQNGKSAEMLELLRSSCNLETGNECRYLMMLQIMAESHPKDLSGERPIQSLKISPSKIVEQVPITIAQIGRAHV